MQVERVQKWVMSALLLTTATIFAGGLTVLAGTGDRAGAKPGLLIIAGVVGLMAMAGVRAINQKSIASPWLLLGLLPAAAWQAAVDQDGVVQEDKHVAEITHLLSRAAGWPDAGQGGQAPHLTVQGRCGPFADAQGGQLGIGPGPLATPPPAGAGSRATVDRGDPDDQAAQEPELQPPLLRGASWGIGPIGVPFFPGSAWSWVVVAWARRLAVIWSARRRKWSWISTSRRAKLAGSRFN